MKLTPGGLCIGPLGRDYFRTLVLFIGAAFLVPAKLHVRPSIILRLYTDTLENASRYRRKLTEPRPAPPVYYSSRAIRCIASRRIASHRNGDARSNSSETASRPGRGLGHVSDQILGRRLAALFLNLLLFSLFPRDGVAATSLYVCGISRRRAPKMLVHLQGAP